MFNLPLFSKVLYFVRENYYDKRRIVARRMLLGALEALSRNVPEIAIEPIPVGAAPIVASGVTVSVSGEVRAFRIDQVDAPWSLRSTLTDILRFAQPRLQPVPEAEEGRRLLTIEMELANGMLGSLDPNSTLIDAGTYASLRGGGDPAAAAAVGLVLALDRQGRIKVVSVIRGGAAERGGVKQGDCVARIDGEPTATLALGDAVDRLRGPAGSGIDLQIEREGTRGLTKIHLLRDPLVIPSIDIEPRMLTLPRVATPVAATAAAQATTKVGYLHLAHLGPDAAGAVKDALARMTEEHAAGIVLDLRGNVGGLYAEAARVADAFVKRGTLVSMVGADPKTARRDETASDDGSEPDVPLAVLVDHRTAAGAEIIAAALRDAGRAIILGQRTFGKGTVQVLFEVDSPLTRAGGTAVEKLSLRLTTAQFLTPADQPIQLAGVAPDVELREVTVDRFKGRARIRMEPVPAARRESLVEGALAPPAVPRPPPSAPALLLEYLGTPANGDDPADPPEYPEPARHPVFSGDDRAVAFAADLLVRAGQPGRARALAAAPTAVHDAAARESTKISAAAGALNLDWRSGARTAGARLSIALEPPAGGVVRAGDLALLRGTVTNGGTAAAFRVRAVLSSDDVGLDRLEMPFGYLAPGATKTFDLLLPSSARTLARAEVVTARLRDGDGDVGALPAEAFFTIEERPRPALSFECLAHEMAVRRDGAPAAGTAATTKAFRLVMRIRNQGPGAAERAGATLRRFGGGTHDGVILRTSRWSGALAPGATHEVSFVVEIPPGAPRDGPVDLWLTAYDPALVEPVTATMQVVPLAPEGRSDWQISPPSVAATPPMVTIHAPTIAPGPTVHLSGEVTDDTGARDVVVFVSDGRSRSRKVLYKHAASSGARLSFEGDIPIAPGANLITASGADEQGRSSARAVVVLRR